MALSGSSYMQVKTTCVRCGKPIHGAYIYCDRCERIIRDGVPASGRTSYARIVLAFVLLLTVAGGGVYFWRQGLISLPGEHQFVRATEVIQDSGQPKTTITESLVAKKLDLKETPEPSPPPSTPAQDASQPPADADLPEPEPEAASEATPPGPPLAQDNATPSAYEVAMPKLTPQRLDIPVDQTPAPPAATDAVTWVFHAQEPGRDEALAATLRNHGFQRVESKGYWMTKFKVNYLFYRPGAENGLDSIKTRTGLTDIKSYPYSTVQTSTNLQRAFEENPTLSYLLIVQ